MNYVVVSPANDPAARTLAGWAGEVERRARGQGHQVVASLSGSTADAAGLTKACAAGRTVCYFGHGTWTSWIGAGSLVDDTNAARLAGCDVVAIACQSAHTLGPAAVAAGASGYLGFDENLLWLTGLPDVALFQDAPVAAVDRLHAGGTLADAATTLRDKYDDLFDYYRHRVPRTRANRTLGYVLADWDHRHVRLCQPPTGIAPAAASSPGVASIRVATNADLPALVGALEAELAVGGVLVDEASDMALVRGVSHPRRRGPGLSPPQHDALLYVNVAEPLRRAGRVHGIPDEQLVAAIREADYALRVTAAVERIRAGTGRTYPAGLARLGLTEDVGLGLVVHAPGVNVGLVLAQQPLPPAAVVRLRRGANNVLRSGLDALVLVSEAEPAEWPIAVLDDLVYVRWRSVADDSQLLAVLDRLLK